MKKLLFTTLCILGLVTVMNTSQSENEIDLYNGSGIHVRV